VAWLDAALKDTTEDKSAGAIRSAVHSVLPHSSLQSASSHPDSEWLTAQMPHGLYCPVFSFLTHTEEQARRLPSLLRYFYHATSLGGVESLIEWRCMSDSGCDKRLLRVSIGLEDVRDLMADFTQAFQVISGLS